MDAAAPYAIEQIIEVNQPQSIPYIKTIIPSSEQEIGEWTQKGISLLNNCLFSFQKALSEGSAGEAVRKWHAATQIIQEMRPVLTFLVPQQFPSLKAAGDEGYKKISDVFDSVVESGQFQQAITKFVEKTDASYLLASETWFFSKILENIPQTEKLSQKFVDVKKSPFTHVRGKAEEKSFSGRPLKVLTLNTLFFPGNFSWYFGGCSPWETRIAAIAEKILDLDADVVGLQEMVGSECPESLCDKLGAKYAHF